MQIGTYKTQSQNLNICFDSQIIEEVKESKFLGIIIDNKCNWKSHVDYVRGRLNRFIYALKRLRQVISITAAITAYYGYVQSVLRYGLLIWGNSTDVDIAFIMQKKCIRAIFGLGPFDSCRPCYKQYKILTLPSIYILEACLFVVNNPECFQRLDQVSNRNLRPQFKNKLYYPRANLATVTRNSMFMCIKIYNKLSAEQRGLTSKELRKSLSKWLTEKCFYSVNEYLNYK